MNGDNKIIRADSQVTGLWAPEKPRKLTLAELKKLFGGHGLTPSVLKRVTRMGIIEIHGLSVQVTSPKLMDIGLQLLELGVPMGEMLDELEALRQIADTNAGRFIALFERNIWNPFVAAGMPADQVQPLTESLEKLAGIATAAVDLILREALRTKSAEFLAAQSRHLTTEALKSRLRPLARAAGLDL